MSGSGGVAVRAHMLTQARRCRPGAGLLYMTGDRALALKKVSSLSSFGEDDSGRSYVVSLEGPVYRLTDG